MILNDATIQQWPLQAYSTKNAWCPHVWTAVQPTKWCFALSKRDGRRRWLQEERFLCWWRPCNKEEEGGESLHPLHASDRQELVQKPLGAPSQRVAPWGAFRKLPMLWVHSRIGLTQPAMYFTHNTKITYLTAKHPYWDTIQRLSIYPETTFRLHYLSIEDFEDSVGPDHRVPHTLARIEPPDCSLIHKLCHTMPLDGVLSEASLSPNSTWHFLQWRIRS